MIGLNRHWQAVQWQDGETPLVVHYAGCSFCSPPTDKLTEAAVTECNMAFMRAYALSMCELDHYYAGGGLAGLRANLGGKGEDGTKAVASKECRYTEDDVSQRTKVAEELLRR